MNQRPAYRDATYLKGGEKDKRKCGEEIDVCAGDVADDNDNENEDRSVSELTAYVKVLNTISSDDIEILNNEKVNKMDGLAGFDLANVRTVFIPFY